MKAGRRVPKRAGGAARSTNRAVIALAVVGGLLLLYGWNSFFLAPRNQAQATVAKDLSAARSEEQTLTQSLTQLKKLAADTQSREAELARLGRLVPTDPDMAGAILALNDTANQAQVSWSSFVPATPAVAGGQATTAVSMKVAGSFNQVFDYLRRLETLDRLVVIDGLQLTGSNGANGASRIDADIKGRMFSAAAATPGSAAANPVGTVAAGGSADAAPSSPAALLKAGG